MSSTKRAWKLQEFVAHGSKVNCLALGHKSGHVMVTGGEDKKVNMWTVGKPNCIMSLTGHTSPVEAVRFGNAEEIVVAGSLSGALKIWDLEAAKIVRTLTGHKSTIKSLDFHPYGDFVASGSLDTNIKIWDIRRKGCIFTYKGHTNCVNSIRFSPDGRWIASAAEDGLLKLWDLTAGKTLTDLKGHAGPVTAVEFHPHDFLLASGSQDRTVRFWDLESFQLVSSTDGSDSTGIRSMAFHPEGLCLYSGATDVLKSYTWEPGRCVDSIPMGWGRVSDISIAQNQLIGATFSQTNVSTYVVDLQRVQPLGGEPLSPPNSSRGRRSFCLDRPPTQSSRRADEPKEEPQEAVTPAEEEDDSQSFAHIQDPEDYNQIFRPKHALARQKPAPKPNNNPAYEAPPVRQQAPFPAPDEERDRPSPATSARSVHQTPPERDHVSKPPTAKPTARDHSRDKSTPTHREPSREKRDTPTHHTPSYREQQSAREPPTHRDPPTHREPPSHREPLTHRESPRDKPSPAMSEVNKLGGVHMDDFLPKASPPDLSEAHLPSEMSEAEAVSAIMRGHDSMALVMASRNKNLQIVRALWTGGNVKTAIDTAISMKDQAVLVDILGIIVQKPSLWSLDMCETVLPMVKDLLSSKYESYVTMGCATLKVILKNFASVIKANMTAPPSVGVDISREERYHKCQQCYSVLMMIRPVLDNKHPLYNKLASKFRELNLLISQLD